MHKCIFIWWQLSTTTLKISAIFKDATPSIQLTSTWTSCSIAQVLLISLTRSLKSSLASEYSRQSILLSGAFYMFSLSGKVCIMKAMNHKNLVHAFKITENDKCFKIFILWIIIWFILERSHKPRHFYSLKDILCLGDRRKNVF